MTTETTNTTETWDSTITAASLAWEQCGYRRSESRWVGGDHAVDVRVDLNTIATPWAGGKSEKVWHHRKVRSGTNSRHDVRLGADWLAAVYGAGLAVVDGMFTLEARRRSDVHAGEEAWTATWVEQGAGFGLKNVHGFILRRDGLTVHGSTMRAARATWTRRAAARATEAAAQAAEVESDDQFAARLVGVVVSIADSRAAGNCGSGTADWIARHLPGATEADAAAVWALARKSGDRKHLVKGALLAALARTGAARG
jgi:hypothetical protein